ncbi:iron-sulfur cluster assembly protein [Caballeronia sp. LjRoot29]|uniref:metal-sulfur cluster assembly factor n=1 Tax=Caballeronia sp. LjRoot29 TaxID=3342315 RepID=UPI003ECE29F9
MTIMAAIAAVDRTAEVWARLESVIDPELDESVTELGFVTGVEVDAGGDVKVDFRLPTYWCAANFAFLMADDMRIAVAALPWVGRVTVGLGEHMYADKINHGVAAGHSFQATFGDEANGEELEEVRRIFMVKAFQRRQEALLTYLLDHGHEPAVLLQLTVVELAALPSDSDGRRLIARYLERRPVIGSDADETAFVDQDGALLNAAQIHAYLRALRRVGVNAEFNSALCRGLLATRYGTECGPQVEVKPVHFVRSISTARSN